MSNPLMQQFVTGLKSRNADVRMKAARDLYHYVSNVTILILVLIISVLFRCSELTTRRKSLIHVTQLFGSYSLAFY